MALRKTIDMTSGGTITNATCSGGQSTARQGMPACPSIMFLAQYFSHDVWVAAHKFLGAEDFLALQLKVIH